MRRLPGHAVPVGIDRGTLDSRAIDQYGDQQRDPSKQDGQTHHARVYLQNQERGERIGQKPGAGKTRQAGILQPS